MGSRSSVLGPLHHSLGILAYLAVCTLRISELEDGQKVSLAALGGAGAIGGPPSFESPRSRRNYFSIRLKKQSLPQMQTPNTALNMSPPKVALVTASPAGLGAAIAKVLVPEMRVVINYHSNPERANTILEELTRIVNIKDTTPLGLEPRFYCNKSRYQPTSRSPKTDCRDFDQSVKQYSIVIPLYLPDH